MATSFFLDEKNILQIVKETDVTLFYDLVNEKKTMNKLLYEAICNNNYEIAKLALEHGASSTCYGHKNFVFSCVMNKNTEMLSLLAKHNVPLYLTEILLVRMIAKGADISIILFFRQQGVDCIQNPWELLLYSLHFERKDVIFFLLKENVSQRFSFHDFTQFLIQVCRKDDVETLCYIHRFYRHLFTSENCKKIMGFCKSLNIPIFLATRFQTEPHPFQTHLHTFLAFSVAHFEKVKKRACNLIARRWIPVCYNVSTERGQRMMWRNYKQFQKMYDE